MIDISKVQYVDREMIQRRMQCYAPMNGQTFYLKRLKPGDTMPPSTGRDGVTVEFEYTNWGFSEVGVTNPFQNNGIFVIFQIYTGDTNLYNHIRQLVIDTAEALGDPIQAEEWNEEHGSNQAVD